MSTSKISPIPTLLPVPALSADKQTITSVSAAGVSSASKPALSSRPRPTAPAAEAGKIYPGARCKATSLTPFGEKLDAMTTRMLPELLGIDQSPDGKPGRITRDVLEQAIASPLQAKDLGKLSVRWPADLINKNTVTDWTQRLVAACDGVYASQGMQAYIEAVTDLIFDEGNDEAGLPGEIRDCCAMLTKNALQAGIDQGLNRSALQGLRNTVILRFLMGSVFVPHLRPSAMRELTNDTGLYAFDRQLFKRFSQKTSEIIDIDAEAMVLLAVSNETKPQAQVKTAPVN